MLASLGAGPVAGLGILRAAACGLLHANLPSVAARARQLLAASLHGGPHAAPQPSSAQPSGARALHGSAAAYVPVTELQPPAHGAAVVLVSGGIRSSTLLSYWQHWSHGQRLYPLFVRYGQANVAEEEAASRAVCCHLGLELATLDAGLVGDDLRTMRGPRRASEGMPHHDLLLLSLGASYGAEVGASQQVLCVSRDDLIGGSASVAFVRHAAALLQMLDPPMRLLTPLAGLSRAGIVRIGQQVSTPWALTYSCIEPSPGSRGAGGAGAPDAHCGHCAHCRARQAAFAEAGVADGAAYAGGEAAPAAAGLGIGGSGLRDVKEMVI